MATHPDPPDADIPEPRDFDPDDGWPGAPLEPDPPTNRPEDPPGYEDEQPDGPVPESTQPGRPTDDSQRSWGQPTILHGSSPGRRRDSSNPPDATEQSPSRPAPDRPPIPEERTTSRGADDGAVEGHDSLEFRPGDRIDRGKYEIIERLGGGGFGEVWKARHVTTRGDRAIKVISPRLVQDDPTLLARFQREAEVLEKIRDQHIVEIKDFIEIQGVPCIIMEFIDGHTLRDLLNPANGPLELPRAARVLKQFCEVLQHAHDHGVVHRDLKPENVMLEAGRDPGKDFIKVLDFGIAKVRFERLGDAVVDSNTITQAGSETPLTPAYGSPEQVQRLPIDHRSDIYSLGVILYEMLAGQRPFRGDNYALMHAHANEKPPAFTTINPSTTCPRTIESVVRKCLKKDPADRYQQARDVWAAFKAALPSEIKVETTQIVSKVPLPPGEFQLEPGKKLDHDKYEVIAKIGGGGFGDVWKARHLGTKGLRAIKVFSPKRTKDDPSFLTRFRREAEVMEKLKDHRVVQIYDYITIGDVPAIVMEFVEGDTLRDRLKIREGPLGLREIALILYPLCRVLQRAHDMGVVHRDLKPENLMLQPGHEPGEEVLKVLDFGIAKVHSEGQEGSSLNNTLTAAGEGPPLTPAYSSPEQARGGDLDHRSDLYTVGVILFELITGQRPFEGNQTSLLVAHSHQSPPAFSRVNPRARCPRAVEMVVRKCLEKAPEDRYQGANALLTAFLAALPKVDRPPTETNDRIPTAPPTPPTIPWRPIAATAGILCAAVLVFAVFKAFWNPSGTIYPPPTPTPTPFPREYIEALGAQGYKHDEKSGLAPGSAGWPEFIVDASTNRRFVFVGDIKSPRDGLYLPDEYEAIEPDRHIKSVDTTKRYGSDGWPKSIARKGTKPRIVLNRIEKPPDGTFQIGRGHIDGFAKDDSNAQPPEKYAPRHPPETPLRGFYMQTCEVTNGEVLAYVRAHHFPEPMTNNWLMGVAHEILLMEFGSNTKKEEELASELSPKLADDRLPPDFEKVLKFPAVKWSWQEAYQFATSHRGDLPSEEQWEFAAESRSDKWDYPWGNDREKWGNFHKDMGAKEFTLEVGYPLWNDLSDQGIWDLAGNVQEWCRDPFQPYPNPRKNSPRIVAVFPPAPQDFVAVRGAHYRWPSSEAPVYLRTDVKAEDRSPNRGFRIVVEGLQFTARSDSGSIASSAPKPPVPPGGAQ